MKQFQRKVTKIGNSFGLLSLLSYLNKLDWNRKMMFRRWTMEIEEEQDFTVDVENHKYTFEEIVSTIESHTEKL